jgi:phosphoglycerate-specific signal transduction histidine kinase
MAEEFSKEAQTSGGERPRSETRQAWEEVGRQFEQLGTSLASAFQALWASQETQQHLESVREGLRSLADEVSEAVTRTASGPEAQKVQAEAQKAAESARQASEKAIEETRPQIVSALKQVNAELQKLIERIESKGGSG